MLLADIVREQKKPQQSQSTPRLTEALMVSLEKFEGSRPVQIDPPPDEDVQFRMSGLEKLCPRMYALAVRDQFSLRTVEGAEKRWIMGTGTAFHTQFQEDYLQTLGEVFQGWWRCRECGRVHQGEKLKGMLSHKWIPKPKMCGTMPNGRDECQSDDFEYVELEFEDKEHRITGHCDGVLVWLPDDIEMLELKTINERGFNYVDPKMGGKPRGGHVIQVNGYMWGVEELGVTRTRVVYIKKTYDPLIQVLAEHVIEKKQDYVDAIRQMLKDSLEAVLVQVRHRLALADLTRDGSEPPEAPEIPAKLDECARKSDYRAKYCPARDPCFKRTKKKK